MLDRSKAKDFLADGLFAYQMIVEICKKELDELYDDGIKYFDLFINFIFDLYEELDRKELEPDQRLQRRQLERLQRPNLQRMHDVGRESRHAPFRAKHAPL